MKAEATITRHLRQLRRECIDGSNDLIEKRIAYAMEVAVRWAREDVRGWPGLAEEARASAQLLRQALKLLP